MIWCEQLVSSIRWKEFSVNEMVDRIVSLTSSMAMLFIFLITIVIKKISLSIVLYCFRTRYIVGVGILYQSCSDYRDVLNICDEARCDLN